MAHRDDIVDYANELLEVHRFPEYGRPGLQVLGADEVAKVACGVSASLELFERAAAAGAQLADRPPRDVLAERAARGSTGGSAAGSRRSSPRT